MSEEDQEYVIGNFYKSAEVKYGIRDVLKMDEDALFDAAIYHIRLNSLLIKVFFRTWPDRSTRTYKYVFASEDPFEVCDFLRETIPFLYDDKENLRRFICSLLRSYAPVSRDLIKEYDQRCSK
jgi:hypothetical protein